MPFDSPARPNKQEQQQAENQHKRGDIIHGCSGYHERLDKPGTSKD